MGICYKLILEDEFDWGYSKTSKEEQLKKFESKFERYIERVATWYGFVVYDIDKATPYMEDRKKLIREYADRAYYIDDLGSGITEIELPRNKPSVQENIDRMNARRTEEEKRASEEFIKERLRVINI